MENNEYEIKVEGTPNTFEGGAIRYNKSKGRFDLIPMEVYGTNKNNTQHIMG